MRDGQTRRLNKEDNGEGLAGYLRNHEVRLVVATGKNAGTHYVIGGERHLLGRGPGVDFAVDDQAMSRQHAAVEYDGRAYRIRDLGSTNGISVNGNTVQVAELSSGDRIEIGAHVLQFVVDVRESQPEVYELTPEG